MTDHELAQEWLAGIREPQRFYPLVSEDCVVWHSTDNKWMPVKEAIEAFAAGGGLPTLSDTSYRLTADGFLVQFSGAIGPQKLHNTILVRTRDGLAYQAEEYVGLEIDHAALAAAHAAASQV